MQPKTTPTAKTGSQETEEIALWQVGKRAAEEFVRKLELSGRPETRSPSWQIMRAGIFAGHATGFDLGVKLGQKLASLPQKDAIDKTAEEAKCPKQMDFDL